MLDIVGKTWAFIFGTLVIFIGTLMLFAQKQDIITQNYVDTVTQEFVDTSRATGTITKAQYQKFVTELDATKNIYSIEMYHYKEKTAPSSDSESSYQSYYDTSSRDRILNTIYDGSGTYIMNNGDFMKVTVTNTKPTFATQLLGIFIGRPTSKGGQIYSSRGGYVGNTR